MQRTLSQRRVRSSIVAASTLKRVEVEINDWRDVKSKRLGKQQTSNDSDAEWTPDFPAGAAAECYRQGAEKGGHRGHHDGTKALQAPLIDSGLWA